MDSMLSYLVDSVIAACAPLQTEHNVKVTARNQYRNPQPKTLAVGYTGEKRGDEVKEGLRSRLVTLECEALIMQPDGRGQGRMLAVIDALIPLLEDFYPFSGWDHLRYIGVNPDFNDDGVIVHAVTFQAICPSVFVKPSEVEP